MTNSNASSNAQSTYLQVLAEAGIAGVLALVLLPVALVRDLAAGLRRAQTVLVAGAAGGLTSLLICWLTDYTIRYVAVAAVCGVLFGLIASQASRQTAGGRT